MVDFWDVASTCFTLAVEPCKARISVMPQHSYTSECINTTHHITNITKSSSVSTKPCMVALSAQSARTRPALLTLQCTARSFVVAVYCQATHLCLQLPMRTYIYSYSVCLHMPTAGCFKRQVSVYPKLHLHLCAWADPRRKGSCEVRPMQSHAEMGSFPEA